MQTFLPYPAMRDSLDALDNKRLNKQILETYQILNVLSGQTQSNAWRNHPAVLMWEGAENELWRYGMTAIALADMRGIKTENNLANMRRLAKTVSYMWGDDEPAWRKNPTILKRVNTTHKANLYRKDKEYYAEYATAVNNKYNQPCCNGCQYFWPTHPLRKNK
jgi:beta-galactosidase/beta-glucuronidase